MTDRVKQIGKSSMIQISLGTVAVLVYTTWRANDFVHSLTGSIDQVGTRVEKVSMDVEVLSSDIGDLERTVSKNSSKIDTLAEDIDSMTLENK